MSARAFICGCAGTVLSDAERRFFREADPLGFILFARNCEGRDQVRALVDALRDTVGRADAPVLIDQEGGRVQRLRPPHWRAYPAARRLGDLYARDPPTGLRVLRNVTLLMARDLHALGINVDCVPVLDVPQPGAHDIIGDRAYGLDVETVVTLARTVATAMLDSGVLPVVKHIPGHGRAMADSHKALPVVDASAHTLRSIDFAPFAAMADMPLAMTAHVVYQAFDATAPATASPVMIGLIRGEIGFDGLLMTDDLGMGALSGTMHERTRHALAAGCDVALHCNGALDEMQAVAATAPELAGQAAARAERALSRLGPPCAFDVDEAMGDLDRVLHESV
jgi:beta-N-acetylhexosaminidase